MEPNKKQRANLDKLADYLLALPVTYAGFNMGTFLAAKGQGEGRDFGTEYSLNQRAAKTECGTIACAIGHGPNAGIRVYKDYTWQGYAERVFGADIHLGFGAYLFADRWARTPDNTAADAGRRIKTFLTSGVPHNYREAF